MRLALRTATVLGALSVAGATAQTPTFHSGVNLLRLDVTFFTDDGTPVKDLRPDEFVVTVDGKPRPVRSAEFIDLRSSGGDEAPSARDPVRSFSTNSPQGTGRITVIAVDEHTLYEGQEMALLEYLGRFLDNMGPADRTGLLVLPHPGGKGRHVEMTNDVGEIREALSRVHGDTRGLPDLNPSATIGTNTFMGANGANPFETPLEEQVMSVVRNELTNLAEVLANVEGPKTLILVSRDVPGGAPNLPDNEIFAEKAARARMKLYVVRQVPVPGVSADGERVDGRTGQGLFDLAGLTGGVVLDAVGRGKGAFDRIARETSGAYLIGVEPDQSTPFSKPLKVDVKVTRPGLTVRSPKQLVPPLTRQTPDLKQTLGTMLMQPRLSTEIPMRIAAFTTRAAEKNKLKSVLVVEMENAESPVAWGFQARQDNKIRADAFEPAAAGEPVDERLRSVSTSAVLSPGQYRLIFGAIGADGRRGTVQHPLEVALHKAGDLEFSDVFVGEAVAGHFRPRIAFGPRASALVAFVELYAQTKKAVAPDATEFALTCDGGRSTDAGVRPFVARGVGQISARPDKTMAQVAIALPAEARGACTVTATVKNGNATGTAERGIVIARAGGPAILQ
jgi:VWFA-related protein